MKTRIQFKGTIDKLELVKEQGYFQLTLKDNEDVLEITLPLNPTYPESSERNLIAKFKELVKKM